MNRVCIGTLLKHLDITIQLVTYLYKSNLMNNT